MRQFPVKSSAPAVSTRIKPAGKIKPAINFAVLTSAMVWVAMFAACAPKAMNAPAKTPRTNWLMTERLAFLTAMFTAAPAISGGVKKLFIKYPPYECMAGKYTTTC